MQYTPGSKPKSALHLTSLNGYQQIKQIEQME